MFLSELFIMPISSVDIARTLNSYLKNNPDFFYKNSNFLPEINSMIRYYGDPWTILAVFKRREDKIIRFDLINKKTGQQIVLYNNINWFSD